MKDKKVMISQPKYMPSLDFIQRLSFIDEFVMMDNTVIDVRDYENRCKVRDQVGDRWLNLQVNKGRLIKNVEIVSNNLAEQEEKLKNYYKVKQPIFRELLPEFDNYYLKFMKEHYELIKERFNLKFNITFSSYFVEENLSGREEIRQILLNTGAKYYFSGNNCLNYGLNKSYLKEINVDLLWFDFKENQIKTYRERGIDLNYSVLDTLNKGHLILQ